MSKSIDLLIIGAGISGINVAQQFIKKGQSVGVVNHTSIPSSSLIAAGTWNPINFKKLTPSWNALEFLAFMKERYLELEKGLNTSFFEFIPLKKVITENEQSFWKKQLNNLSSSEFLGTDFDNFNQKTLGEIKQTGRINIPKLVDAYTKHLEKNHLFLEEVFDYAQLRFESDKWVYKDEVVAKNVVFCEGVQIKNNPFFSWMPLKPAKGDVIKIEAPQLNIEYMLKKGIFIVPESNHQYIVGATYEWNDLTWTPSEKAKTELLSKLEDLIGKNYKVVNHQAGIRPSSLDRRPVIGEHPNHKGLWIFNGMGAKGVFLAPKCSDWLYQNIVKNQPIPSEVALQRLLKKHYSIEP